MISDTLFDAIVEIDRYLTDPVFAGAYSDPDLRTHIERVRGEMEALRVRLDEVAPASEPQTCCDFTGCDSVSTIEDIDGRHVCVYHGDA